MGAATPPSKGAESVCLHPLRVCVGQGRACPTRHVLNVAGFGSRIPLLSKEGWTRHQEKRPEGSLLKARTGCVSRMNETLSRKENGAVHVGNIDLILPVRVRTCAEALGRTGGAGPLGMQPVRASNGRNGEASQRYSEGRRVGLSDVRASTL